MNDAIDRHAWTISKNKDILLVQTKRELHLFQIQTLEPGNFRLFHLKRGVAHPVLLAVSERQVTHYIARFNQDRRTCFYDREDE